MPVRTYLDLYGNPCVRAVLPAGRSSFRYDACATVPDATEEADEWAPECPPHAVPEETVACSGAMPPVGVAIASSWPTSSSAL